MQRLMELLPPSWSEKARSLKVNPRVVDYEPATKIKHIKANVISALRLFFFFTTGVSDRRR